MIFNYQLGQIRFFIFVTSSTLFILANRLQHFTFYRHHSYMLSNNYIILGVYIGTLSNKYGDLQYF